MEIILLCMACILYHACPYLYDVPNENAVEEIVASFSLYRNCRKAGTIVININSAFKFALPASASTTLASVCERVMAIMLQERNILGHITAQMTMTIMARFAGDIQNISDAERSYEAEDQVEIVYLTEPLTGDISNSAAVTSSNMSTSTHRIRIQRRGYSEDP